MEPQESLQSLLPDGPQSQSLESGVRVAGELIRDRLESAFERLESPPRHVGELIADLRQRIDRETIFTADQFARTASTLICSAANFSAHGTPGAGLDAALVHAELADFTALLDFVPTLSESVGFNGEARAIANECRSADLALVIMALEARPHRTARLVQLPVVTISPPRSAEDFTPSAAIRWHNLPDSALAYTARAETPIVDRSKIRGIKERLRNLGDFLSPCSPETAAFSLLIERGLRTRDGVSCRTFREQALEALRGVYRISCIATIPDSDPRKPLVGRDAEVFLSLLAEIPRIAAVLGFNQETGTPCPAIVKQDARFLALDRDYSPYHWEPPTKIKGRKDAADNASTPSEDGTASELASELEERSEPLSSYEEGSEADVELEGQWEREQGGATSKAEIPPAESPAKLDVGKAKKKLPTVAQIIAASEPTKPLTPPRIGPSADALNSEKEWNPKIPKLLRDLSLVTKRVGTKGIAYDQLEIILPAAKVFCSDYKQLRVRWDDNDIAIPGPCHSIPWETVEKAAKVISVFGANLVGALQAACAPSLERREIQNVFAEFTAMFDLNSVSYYTGEILNLLLEFAKKIPRSK